MSFKIATVIIVVSIIIVVLTPLFTSVTVTQHDQLRDLRFGALLPIVQQDCTLTPPDNLFPYTLVIQSPWENPTRILWGNFFASVVLVAKGLIVSDIFCTGI